MASVLSFILYIHTVIELYKEEKDVCQRLGASTYAVNMTIADVLTKLGRTTEADEILLECANTKHIETEPEASEYETVS